MDRYIVIRRDSIGVLELAVNAYIHQKGYEPIGGILGVATNPDKTEVVWCQAMFKRQIDI